MSIPAQGHAADVLLPQPGDVVAGKYRIERLIGRGGMGAVLASTELASGRRVAIKWKLRDACRDADSTQRMIREAQATATVRHPNVVEVYDVGEHQGSVFLVMELLEGDTLGALLDECGVLGARMAVELLLPAMRGVEAAHRQHVIHRDLKPTNIFLERRPDRPEVIPRVVDFGISKFLTQGAELERSLTDSGIALGTPHYMAPEQLRAEPLDARADVYALGVILYRCLTGRLPFHDANYNVLVLQIATADATPITELRPHLAPDLAATVMRAMARDREARFQTITELIAALEQHGQTIASERAPVRTGARLRRWTLLALGLMVIGALSWLALSR